MRNFVRDVYYRATKIKAQLSGLKSGNNVRISPKGRINISGGSSVTIGDNVVLSKDYQIDAHGGSEISICSNVFFAEGAKVQAGHGAKITIDEGCFFNHNVSIIALHGVSIGKDSIFAPYVYLSDNNHQIAKDELIKKQSYDTEFVSIGSDVWMGVGATVLKGGCVGDGSVVAARAVVNKHISDHEIWGGIPAKKIGERR